jgi:hypothetical protein
MTDSWQQKAERISKTLASEPAGTKMLRIERIAHEAGLSAETVHQLLRAFDFLARVRSEDEELATLLTPLPYQAVLAAERWCGRNRRELASYLKSNAKPSVRQLTAAEKESRILPPATGAPANHTIEVLQSAGGIGGKPGPDLRKLLQWRGIKPFDLSSVAWEREQGDYERSHGIEFHGLTPPEQRPALLVGPNSEASGYYMRNAKLIWFNAVSAANLFPIVIMLLPSRAAQSACLTSMPLPPSGERGWPKWNALNAAVRGKPRSGPARPATPTAGIILFTTPEDVLSDWRR